MIIHTLKELGKIHPPNWLVNIEGALDLQRNNEQLKAIRRAEWTEQQVVEYFKTTRGALHKVNAPKYT